MVRTGRPDPGKVLITGLRTPWTPSCVPLRLPLSVTLPLGRNLWATSLVLVGMDNVMAGLLLEFTVILSELLLTLTISR